MENRAVLRAYRNPQWGRTHTGDRASFPNPTSICWKFVNICI